MWYPTYFQSNIKGTVIGVLGIDVSHEYLKTLLNYLELDSDAKGAYSLILEENGKYTDILTNNSYFAVDFKTGDQLKSNRTAIINI